MEKVIRVLEPHFQTRRVLLKNLSEKLCQEGLDNYRVDGRGAFVGVCKNPAALTSDSAFVLPYINMQDLQDAGVPSRAMALLKSYNPESSVVIITVVTTDKDKLDTEEPDGVFDFFVLSSTSDVEEKELKNAAGLILEPEIMVLPTNNSPELLKAMRIKACMVCGELAKPLRLCGGCKMIRYCSVNCQTKHWPFHKSACKLFK